MGAAQRTHYEALGVAHDATYAQIRASYLSSLLLLHPDKQLPAPEPHSASAPSSSSSSSSPSGGSSRSFLAIQEAWNVLKDPAKRSSYDLQLLSKLRSVSYDANNAVEHVSLGDMNMETCPSSDDGDGDGDAGPGDVFYVYPCRCGDFFSVSRTELQELELEETNRCGPHDQHSAKSLIIPCSSCSLRIGLTLSDNKIQKEEQNRGRFD